MYTAFRALPASPSYQPPRYGFIVSLSNLELVGSRQLVTAAPKRLEDLNGWGYTSGKAALLHLWIPELLFLSASSFFECQVNQRATCHVVISQGV